MKDTFLIAFWILIVPLIIALTIVFIVWGENHQTEFKTKPYNPNDFTNPVNVYLLQKHIKSFLEK